MNALFRPLFLMIIAGTSGFFSACGSKSDVWPTVTTPQTGNLSGQVLPGLAATSVTARSSLTGQQITVVPTDNGDYLFKNITIGTWAIIIAPAPGYNWIDSADGQVKAGSTESIGTTFLQTTTAPGGWWLMDNKYNGVCSYTQGYQSGILTFSYSTPSKNMSVALAGIDASPISFPMSNSSSSSHITFSSTNTQGVIEQWTTVGGSGTISVSVYATNPRRVSGTFTCQAVPANSVTVASKQISGTFNNVVY